MLPSMFSNIATRLFRRRWWFVLVSIVGLCMLIVSMIYAPGNARLLAGIIVGPLIFLPWALLCTCMWFHPAQGNLQPGSRYIGKLPPMLQSALRWYASLFLIVFVLAGLVICPLILMTMG
ncbi:hypothetical protein CR152_19890 [Massilia violaceinigra]|uniref:Uncharacterized protein n=1 Tax=Massilia violaceinigra TaxID=2045208 RepID=A0A2D2DNG8_9BURK|nr:hypothetical protein CR152_19890 [Massilia violaceinigra]